MGVSLRGRPFAAVVAGAAAAAWLAARYRTWRGARLAWPMADPAAPVADAALFLRAGAPPAPLGLLTHMSERFPKDRGAIMGLYSVFLAIGQIVGALIGGVAADARGIDGMLIATVVLLIVALVPLAQLRRDEEELSMLTRVSDPASDPASDRPSA